MLRGQIRSVSFFPIADTCGISTINKNLRGLQRSKVHIQEAIVRGHKEGFLQGKEDAQQEQVALFIENSQAAKKKDEELLHFLSSTARIIAKDIILIQCLSTVSDVLPQLVK